jgi:hypothetical protein
MNAAGLGATSELDRATRVEINEKRFDELLPRFVAWRLLLRPA